MIKNIVVFGSTGSIGKTLLSLIKNNKIIRIKLLTCDKNINLLLKQAKLFNVRNLIITNKSKFKKAQNSKEFKLFNIYNDFSNLEKILKNKVDYVMNSIVGFDGLKPTLEIIRYTRFLAIANKESIICGWGLIKKKILQHNVKIIPVDSEHYSIKSLINYSSNYNNKEIDQIILTASGGPLYNTSFRKFNKISISDATNHPNWKMGKKISIDSATLVNKVFEVIEAQRLFDVDIKNIHIKIHSKSYVHSIIKFKNGLIKICAHKPNMIIPIAGSLDIFFDKFHFPNKINFKILNNLKLKDPNKNKFIALNILKNYKNYCSLYDTALVSCNDTLVTLFLLKKIKFNQISINLNKILKSKKIVKLKDKVPQNYDEVKKIHDYVRLKTINLCIE